MPESAIKFGSYEAAKHLIATIEGHGDPVNIRSTSRFLAGGIAGMISQYASKPQSFYPSLIEPQKVFRISSGYFKVSHAV